MLSRWLTRSRSRGGGDDADFVSIESSEEKTVEITDLTPETSYKLTAIAYNADQRPSNPATATFTTPEKPTTPDPDKATISIEEVKATYNSVTFTLKTANAARFGYKVDVPDGTAELTFVNGSEGGTYTTDNLEAATDYQITAVAYDENGQAADPVTHAFKTEALPTGPAVVSIEGEALGGYVLVNFLCERDRAFLALRERDGFGQASGTDRQHGGAAAGIRIGFGRHRDGGRAGSSALGRYAAPLPGRRGGDFGTPCRVGGESDRFRSSAGRKCLLRSAGKRQFGSRSVVLLVASGQPCGGKG